MFFHPPRGSETRRTAASCRQQQRCTHGPAGRGDELPVPRGEVGQVRPRRSRGAAEGERAGPSGGAVPPPQRGGIRPRPPSPARAPPGEARGGTPAPRVVRPGPPVPAVHSGGRASRPAPAAGPTWLPRVPGCFRGPAPASLPRHGREALPGLLPGGGAAALLPLRPGGPLSAGHPARLHGGAARSEALRAVLPGGACPVIPFCFAWFPRGFGKMASPPPR